MQKTIPLTKREANQSTNKLRATFSILIEKLYVKQFRDNEHSYLIISVFKLLNCYTVERLNYINVTLQ